MYQAFPDPYCYPGTDILKNRLNLRVADELVQFEAASVFERGSEPLPAGRLSVTHYRAIHRHLFQDVYSWAGRYRTVRMAKGGNMFCYPENIAGQMTRLFARLKTQHYFLGASRVDFARACASLLANLNAIHPFREGNGRTQMAFVAVLAFRAGFPLALDRLAPDTFLAAMIASFAGNDDALAAQVYDLIAQ